MPHDRDTPLNMYREHTLNCDACHAARYKGTNTTQTLCQAHECLYYLSLNKHDFPKLLPRLTEHYPKHVLNLAFQLIAFTHAEKTRY